MEDPDSPLGFNFWPSFADSMLAFVLILVLLLIYVVFNSFLGVAGIKEAQRALTFDIAERYGGEVDTVKAGPRKAQLVISKGGQDKVDITNEVQLQYITFRGNVLFPQNSYRLSEEGKTALRSVGVAISERLGAIQRIQIEGHTDVYPTSQYEEGNLELGALRAIAVFRFLEEDVSINPNQHLMSITSYGEYKPVQRKIGQTYNRDSLREHNETNTIRTRNRRTELLLFYRSEEPQ